MQVLRVLARAAIKRASTLRTQEIVIYSLGEFFLSIIDLGDLQVVFCQTGKRILLVSLFLVSAIDRPRIRVREIRRNLRSRLRRIYEMYAFNLPCGYEDGII